MVTTMNPGILNERISVLELNQNGNSYDWQETSSLWAKVEQLNEINIFSKTGLGAKSIKFTIRRHKELTLHNAFAWRGKHCFLTNINDIDRAYYEVTAALVEPVTCTVMREGEPKLNELNRPVYGEPIIITFPGCLTEKYMGHVQNEPMTTKEIRYVLVTPKPIKLNCGELVTIDNLTYYVLITHELDEYKNEYEIMYKGDI